MGNIDMPKPDEAYKDLKSLSDEDLDAHIDQIKLLCKKGGRVEGFVMEEAMGLLQIAITEKNGRKETKQAETANKIAKIALGVAIVGLIIAIVGIWQ